MKYFDKVTNGFYEEDSHDRIEISNDHWQELLNKQSMGGKIQAIEDEVVCIFPSDEEKAQKEVERIQNLTLTKRVFALALQQLGVSYTQLKELIATSEQAQLEWDLCVELVRNNPLLDLLAPQMGVTSLQLDYIFRVANGETVDALETEE